MGRIRMNSKGLKLREREREAEAERELAKTCLHGIALRCPFRRRRRQPWPRIELPRRVAFGSCHRKSRALIMRDWERFSIFKILVEPSCSAEGFVIFQHLGAVTVWYPVSWYIMCIVQLVPVPDLDLRCWAWSCLGRGCKETSYFSGGSPHSPVRSVWLHVNQKVDFIEELDPGHEYSSWIWILYSELSVSACFQKCR